jgi:integrase
LCWSDVDFRQRTVRDQLGVVRGQAKARTKTYLVRDVELSDRAWVAIEAQRTHTQLAGKEVDLLEWCAMGRHSVTVENLATLFEALGPSLPRTVSPAHVCDARAHGWRESFLSRVSSVNTNTNMHFRVYSKWIDGADKSRERDKLNLGFGHDLATELIAEAKFAQSNCA